MQWKTIMTTADDYRARPSNWMNVLALTMVFATCTISNSNAWAQILVPDSYRYLEANDKYDGVRLQAIAFELRPPRRLRSRHFELAIGRISSEGTDRSFVSVGPVWRIPLGNGRAYADVGISPTYLSGSTFQGRDLGGQFHFTSSISIGTTFGPRQAFSVSLRAQHTSNGGLSDTNPGIDMFGVNVAFNFPDRRRSANRSKTH